MERVVGTLTCCGVALGLGRAAANSFRTVSILFDSWRDTALPQLLQPPGLGPAWQEKQALGCDTA